MQKVVNLDRNEVRRHLNLCIIGFMHYSICIIEFSTVLQTGCAWPVRDRPRFEVVAMGVSQFEPQRVEQSLLQRICP